MTRTATAGRKYRIAIIGSGFSGLCLGIHLKKAGMADFTIFEKAERVGGTWRDNAYPGAACDVPSFAYCFSFEQKTDWSRKWSAQPEILAYMEHCVDKYGLRPHLRFGTEIASAEFDATAAVWRLRTVQGEESEAEVLVSGVGQLSLPNIPKLPGLDDFQGRWFHSARWPDGDDLDGKDVAVIGNAASAIQFIPVIAPRVRRLDIFQRSANWMVPRNDRAYSAAETARFGRHPWLARLYRWSIWARYEMTFFPIMRRRRYLADRIEKLSTAHMKEQVHDPKMRKALVPDYPVGARRMLISDDYYSTLNRPNVRLLTTPIDHIDAGAVVTTDGTRHPAEVIILATGFRSTSFLSPMQLRGAHGQQLDQVWKDGAQAFLGLTVPGFPNFFLMYGPNTNLGHNSIIFMIECQTAYILDCLRQMQAHDLRSIDVRSDVSDAYNAELQQALSASVWAQTDHSWYKTASGKITNNWSGPTFTYWWRTRRAHLHHYHCEPPTTAIPIPRPTNPTSSS